jgi:hypothetical protein
MIDVPYEISALSIGIMGESATIYVRSKLLDEKPCVFATYSNADKALKVMEMVREEYLETVYDYRTRPKVFKFPSDEEVEV